MAVYTTNTRVKDEIPGDLPASLTDAKIDGYIGDASREIDGRLELLYEVPFNDITAGTPTPIQVRNICNLLALHKSYIFMSVSRDDESATKTFVEEADRLLEELNPVDGSRPKAVIIDDAVTPRRRTALHASELKRNFEEEETADINDRP